MKKKFPILIILTISFMIISTFLYLNNVTPTIQNDKKARTERISSVLNDVWDRFGFFSYQIGNTDTTIWIVMDDSKNEEELMTYLTENLSPSDLKYYNIKILKKNKEEAKVERAMQQISYLIFDYIQEKGYKNIKVMYPTFDKMKGLITIENSSEVSNEVLKKEFENLVVNHYTELSIDDKISYEIQLITPNHEND
ncbi:MULTISPECIES: hypothetical protein [Ureibacillus]|uniref:hypothetical protein n=1 Tax=Ureibacillus TaxID=160795 RepID=UPI0030C9436C